MALRSFSLLFGSISDKGARGVPASKPKRFMAAFAGIGLTSRKQACESGRSLSWSAHASSVDEGVEFFDIGGHHVGKHRDDTAAADGQNGKVERVFARV